MEVLYREQLTDIIASKLKIPKRDVDLIIYNYICYLQEELLNNKTVKVLNICYIKNTNEVKSFERETLGYISSELSMLLSLGTVTILRVLNTLEEVIVKELLKGNSVSIRGLIRVKAFNDNGILKVRIKKSTKYNNKPMYIVTLNSFVRKVGVQNAG